MYIGFRRKPWRAGLLAVALLLPAAAARADDGTRARAVALYDEARYAEARGLIEALDAAGQADGAMLYRLYYCQRLADDPAAQATLQRARARLEEESPSSPSLEAPFYLANTYRNIAKLTDMRRVAEQTVRRVEQGELPEPEGALDQFRLGKLYADLERAEEAARWYARSVEGLSGEESKSHAVYLQWAAGYLSDHAAERGDFAAAQRYLGVVLDAQPQSSKADLDRLAVLQVRAGRYAEAGQTWRRVAQLDPADANRARYSQHLTRMAAELPALPDVAADGRPWTELTKEELEQTLLDRAAEVRAAIAEAGENPGLEPKARQKLQRRIDDARPVFVSAALEYVARGLSIREHAFFGGYAPLIFRERDWKLPGG